MLIERLFREWKRESEIYCKSSDEFLVTMKNNRRQGIEITSRLNLVETHLIPGSTRFQRWEER